MQKAVRNQRTQLDEFGDQCTPVKPSSQFML